MSDVLTIIDTAADRYGVPRSTARGIAWLESKFKPDAQNPKSSAGGIYQFIDSTWSQYGQGARKYDANANADAGMRFLKDNSVALRKALGRAPTGPELYLAHQQGPGGAIKLLTNPNGDAVATVGADAVRLNGGQAGWTNAQFAALWTDKAAKAMNRFGGELPEGIAIPHANPTPSYLSWREEADYTPDQISYLEGLKLAIKSEWAGSWALAQMGQEEFQPDHDFQYDEQMWAEVTEGLPEAYHSMFEGAVSTAHARRLRERAQEMVEVDQKLATLGGWGTAMSIGAAVLDPVAIGVSVLTEGVAAPVVFGAKVTRAGRALRAGASAAAGNAAVEAYIASQDPTRGAGDILLAGATGLAVGGALGAFIPTKMDMELEKVGRELRKEFVQQEGSAQSMGAAFVGSTGEPVLTAAERQLKLAADAPRSALGRARIDMVGMLKQSEHPIVRRLAGAIAEDGVGNADGSVLQRSASENVTHAMKTRMTLFYRKAEPAFKEWAKEAGVPLWKRGAYREKFFDEVGLAVRRQRDFYTDNPHINQVADAMRDMQRDLLSFAREKGLRGFDKVAENDQYLMRVFHHQRLDKLFAKFGAGKMNRMVANALLQKSDNLDYEDALDIASAYLKSVRSQKYQDAQLSMVFSEDQADLLEEMLMNTGDLTAERIAQITSAVRKPQTAGNEGKIARGKRRLQLDETYRETYVDADGKHHTVGVEDFLDNNAERLMTLYTRQISGAGFMEEALRAFRVPRGDGEVDAFAPSIDTIKQHIRDTAGEFNMNPKQLDAEIDKIDVLYRAVMGIPLSKTTKGSEALRLLRDYNFIRVMNQVGFAQIAEIGNILGSAGWQATLQHVPALRGIWSRAKDGKMADELLDEIEVIWGIGTDRLRRSTVNRMDDYGVYEGAGVGAVDNALQTAKHITADISFMAPVNMALQRMAGRAAIQRWMNDALGGRGFSKSRLHAMGVSEEMAGRIKAQMVDHVDVQEGMLGRGVKRLNIDEWADDEAAQAFIHAIDRWSRKIIQENDIGQMSKWMTTDLGKTMIQFRSFMVAAWTKQTLTGVHHKDWDTFVMWSTGILFGGLSYTAQQHINAVGREDAKEYLQERLNPSALGRSAFQRAGFSTIIPGAADSMLQLVGYEPVFAYGRSTGLASNALLGNPTTDLMDKSVRAIRGVTASAARGDYDFSQQDWRAASSLVPFQNAMGIRNTLQMLGQNLPRFSE